MRLIFIIILAFCATLSSVNAQYLYGKVTDMRETALPMATVVWTGSTIGTRCDVDGEFELPLPSKPIALPAKVTVIFGAVRDTFTLDDLESYWTLQLNAEMTLQEVEVSGVRTGAYISVLQPVKTEIINRAELRKAACCDLAGCFETQSTVQPTTTNVLTNAKELRILGLSGVYNQILLDGLPVIQGLTYTYGTGSIPGSMLENIWVSKGANSVLQGYESMVGQITIFPREGAIAEPFTADVLMNSFGEKHLNTGFATRSSKWNSYTALHASLPGGRWDRDDDGFLDLPLLTRYSGYTKWRYRKEDERGFSAFVSGRMVREERVGGQRDFRADRDLGGNQIYGQSVGFWQPELISKAGWRFDENRKISLLSSFTAQDQDSWFGLTHYQAGQRQINANLQYELFWGKNKLHDLKTGISFRHFRLREDIAFAPADTLKRTYAGAYFREENIPGLFAENAFHWDDDRWVWIVGLRADRHNQFGATLTPRTMLRFNPTPSLDLRASLGAGWRTVNLFPENIGLLTGNRDIVFVETLRPERSWNGGINATQRFNLVGIAFTASADFYHTRFSNQFFPDFDTDPNLAIVANFTERSIGNGLQLELIANREGRVEFRAAYNFLDVYRRINGENLLLPFNPRQRVLAAATYRDATSKWQFDTNVHWYGVQRLPDTRSNPENLRRPDFSDPYMVASVQVRRKLGAFDLFAGCENIFDFRQLRPLLGWENPFAPGFDPSFAWGPTRGREFYLGCNYAWARSSK